MGPKTAAVIDYVTAYPGENITTVARRFGPHGSLHYGWKTVQRALATGRIVRKEEGQHVRLYPA